MIDLGWKFGLYSVGASSTKFHWIIFRLFPDASERSNSAKVSQVCNAGQRVGSVDVGVAAPEFARRVAEEKRRRGGQEVVRRWTEPELCFRVAFEARPATSSADPSCRSVRDPRSRMLLQMGKASRWGNPAALWLLLHRLSLFKPPLPYKNMVFVGAALCFLFYLLNLLSPCWG